MSVEIPIKYQDIAREFIEVCKKHGLRKFVSTISVPYDRLDGAWNEINFGWEQGRHGADEDQIQMGAAAHVHMTVKVKP